MVYEVKYFGWFTDTVSTIKLKIDTSAQKYSRKKIKQFPKLETVSLLNMKILTENKINVLR